MDHRRTRLLRGWLGALTATGLAAASHALAGGGLPAVEVLVLLLVASAAICTAFAGRGLSLARTTLAVLCSQAIYHLAFGLGHPAGGSNLHTPAMTTPGRAGHGTHGVTGVDSQMLISTATTTASGPVPTEAAWMPVAHVVAALCTVLALRRGELAARAVADTAFLAAPLRVLRLKPAPVEVRVLLPDAVQVPGLPVLGVPLRALLRRGPPACPAP